MIDAVRDESPDEVLAAQVSEDSSAFSELYRRHVDAVYRYLRYQAPDEEAKDLTAQVFFQAYRAAGQFRGDGASYRAWLFRIAHNTLASWRRSRHRMPVPVPEVPEPSEQSESADPGIDRELRAVLWEAVSQLPPSDRELIELRYVEGLQPREIAHVTGGSNGAVRVRVHRALKRLKGSLEEKGVRK